MLSGSFVTVVKLVILISAIERNLTAGSDAYSAYTITAFLMMVFVNFHEIIASNDYAWESTLKNGIWIYTLEQAKIGLADCYAGLKQKFETKYRRPLAKVGSTASFTACWQKMNMPGTTT